MKPKRCDFHTCNKKIGLTNLPCRCKLSFCDKHRLPEEHQCSYDFKANVDKDKLLKEMKVIADKVPPV